MDETIDILETAEQLLAQAPTAPLSSASDDELMTIVGRAEAVARRLTAIRVFTAAEIDERSRIELGDAGLSRRYGYQRGSHLIEGVTRTSSGEARRRIQLGSQVTPRVSLDGSPLLPLFPSVSDALAGGRIGLDAAGHIVRALAAASSRSTVDDLAAAENAVVAESQTTSADLIRDQARAWRDHLDTDGAEPHCDLQHAERSLHVGREREDGMTPFTGLADPISAGILRAGLSAFRSKVMMAEQRGSGDDLYAESAGTPDVSDDAMTPETLAIPEVRTSAQQNFDILLGLVEAGIHADSTVRRGGRASVVATVRLDDLLSRTGVGWLDDVRESLSMAEIDTLACDSGVEIAVTNDNGAIVALTSTQEFFTAAQRRALAARDGGCVWNNCHSPASWADAHHVIERQDGGRTDVSNGVMLCPPHHRMLHTSEFRLRMIRGRPFMLAPPSIDPGQKWRPVGKSRAELLGRVEEELPRSAVEPSQPRHVVEDDDRGVTEVGGSAA